MSRTTPGDGDHAVHIGSGSGYYTAILAHLVGPSGRVTALEFELDLAARAADNLSRYANVTVIDGDGSNLAFEPTDIIYVNAGATRPADNWLEGAGRRWAPDPAADHRPRVHDRRVHELRAPRRRVCDRAQGTRLSRQVDFAGCHLSMSGCA